MCALLAPDEIPLPLLLSQPRLLSEPLASTVADSVRHGEVAGILYRQGLLTWDPEAGIARIHRLVQDVILAHLPGANRRQRTVEAVELLAGLFPHEGEDPVGWPRCAQLLTHAQAVLAHAWGFITPATSDLLTYTGGYLRGRRLDMRVAQELDEQALAIRQRLYEGDHLEVAQSLHNLAADLHMLGEFGRAMYLHEQALAMGQRLAGS